MIDVFRLHKLQSVVRKVKQRKLEKYADQDEDLQEELYEA